MKLSFIVLLVALIAGCATSTSGAPFAAEMVQTLVPGQTTAAQAETALGTPLNVWPLGEGELVHQWNYIASHARTGLLSDKVDVQHQMVMIVFSTDGVMQRIAYQHPRSLSSNLSAKTPHPVFTVKVSPGVVRYKGAHPGRCAFHTGNITCRLTRLLCAICAS